MQLKLEMEDHKAKISLFQKSFLSIYIRGFLLINIIFFTNYISGQSRLSVNSESIFEIDRNEESFLLNLVNYRKGGDSCSSKLIKTDSDLNVLWEVSFKIYYQNYLNLIHFDSEQIFVQLVERESDVTKHYILEVNPEDGKIISKTNIEIDNISSIRSTKVFNDNKIYFDLEVNDVPHLITFDILTKQFTKVKVPFDQFVFAGIRSIQIYDDTAYIIYEDYVSKEKFSRGLSTKRMKMSLVSVKNNQAKILTSFIPEKYYSNYGVIPGVNKLTLVLENVFVDNQEIDLMFKTLDLTGKVIENKYYNECFTGMSNPPYGNRITKEGVWLGTFSDSTNCYVKLSSDGTIVKSKCIDKDISWWGRKFVVDDEIYAFRRSKEGIEYMLY